LRLRFTEGAMTAPRPDLAPPPASGPPAPAPGVKISLIQVTATALAAITATVVASFLGVAGTVVGAAVASTLSVVGTAVYGHSLRRTQERVRAVVPVRRPSTTPYRPLPRDARPGPHAWAQPTYYPARATVVAAERPGRRSLGARLAIGSAALFAAVLAVVTGVEAVAHRPISDLVRGESGSGTTLFGGSHSSSSATSKAAPSSPTAPSRQSGAPTVTRTVTRSAPPSATGSAPTSSPTTARPSPSSSAPPSPSATDGTGTSAAPSGAGGGAAGRAAGAVAQQ
jgi:hypothetical protein